MSRRTLFAGFGAGALILVFVAAGGVAIAVAQGQSPPDDRGPARTTSTSAPADDGTSSRGAVGGLSLAARLHPWGPGDRIITEKELRDFHATLPTASVVGPAFEKLMKTNLLTVDCMRSLDFYWDPRVDPRLHPDLDPSKVDPDAWAALHGDDPTNPDWTQGGCDQYAAHLTGLDGGPGVPGTKIPGYTAPKAVG